LLSENVKFKINRNVFLSAVLYGCETWCLTRREGYRLKVFEIRAPRSLLGPVRENVWGDW
jgi:hypothetical protein